MSKIDLEKLQQQPKERHRSIAEFEKKVLIIKMIAQRINKSLGVEEIKW